MSDNAKPFETLSERIVHNAAAPFGGAYCIVAPDGTTISDLSLADPANPAQFWSSLISTIQIKLDELNQKQAQRAAFGMR